MPSDELRQREGESWESWRRRLSLAHDDDAFGVLDDVLDSDTLPVRCGSYCLGGTARPDIPEILACLAEAGWRLTRVEAVGDVD